MRRITFEVVGHLPPKKDGATSMWQRPAQVPRLLALRAAAATAFGGQPPLRANIRLSLSLKTGSMSKSLIGDLDSLVAGICDGLMAAGSRAYHHVDFRLPENETIHPGQCIGILDDAEVVAIQAEKFCSSDGQPSYKIILEGD